MILKAIEWRYTLKPETINISRYQDDERGYFEVAVIQVTLKEAKRYRRIAQITQRAIPYPLLIVFKHGATIALSVVAKRINRADREKILAQELQETHWINLEKLLDYEEEFLEQISITNFSYHNFYEFYNDLTDRITAMNCAVHTGCYSLTTKNTEDTKTGKKAGQHHTSEPGNQLKRLMELERLQQKKAELRNRLKKEKNMGTQVELNTQVKQLSDRIKDIITGI